MGRHRQWSLSPLRQGFMIAARSLRHPGLPSMGSCSGADKVPFANMPLALRFSKVFTGFSCAFRGCQSLLLKRYLPEGTDPAPYLPRDLGIWGAAESPCHTLSGKPKRPWKGFSVVGLKKPSLRAAGHVACLFCPLSSDAAGLAFSTFGRILWRGERSMCLALAG